MLALIISIIIGCTLGFGLALWIGATILERDHLSGANPDVYYKFSPILREHRQSEISGDAKTHASYLQRNQGMLLASDMYKNYKKHAINGDMYEPMSKYMPGSEPMDISELGNVEDSTYDDLNDLDDFGRLKK